MNPLNNLLKTSSYDVNPLMKSKRLFSAAMRSPTSLLTSSTLMNTLPEVSHMSNPIENQTVIEISTKSLFTTNTSNHSLL
jgi:hypothetical protein